MTHRHHPRGSANPPLAGSGELSGLPSYAERAAILAALAKLMLVALYQRLMILLGHRIRRHRTARPATIRPDPRRARPPRPKPRYLDQAPRYATMLSLLLQASAAFRAAAPNAPAPGIPAGSRAISQTPPPRLAPTPAAPPVHRPSIARPCGPTRPHAKNRASAHRLDTRP